MQKSRNVLTIESITHEFVVPDPFTSFIEAKMKANIQCYGPNKNLLKGMIYTITGEGQSTSLAVHDCVNNFINHKVREKHTEYYRTDENCEADLSEIHAIEFNSLVEPFYSIFLGLMNPNDWRAPSEKEKLPLPELFYN